MPLYEYRCEACGRVCEILQRLGESAAGGPCPSCGAAELTRALSTFAAGVGAGSAGASVAACAPNSAFT